MMVPLQICVLADTPQRTDVWEEWLRSQGYTISAPPTPRTAPNAHALLLVAESAHDFVRAVQDHGWEYGLDLHLVAARPVLALDGAMSALFDTVEGAGTAATGLGQWPGKASSLPTRGSVVDLWAPSEVPTLAGVPWPKGTLTMTSSALCIQWELAPHGPFTAVTPDVTWADTAPPTVVGVHNGPLRAAAVASSPGSEGGELVTQWLDQLAAQ